VEVLRMPEIKASVGKIRGPYAQRDFLRANGRALEYITIRLLKSEDSIPPSNKSQIYIIQDEPEYNLNFGDLLNSIQEIHEHYIVCSFTPISFHHICEMLPAFKPGPDRSVLISEQSQKIPSLSYKGLGEVHFASGRTIFGGRGARGACVSNVPASLPSTKPYLDFEFSEGSRVIACSTRTVPKELSFQVIDSIQSVASFKALLLRALKAAL
jgi:hypothetical protein